MSEEVLHPLAETAEKAVTDSRFDGVPHHCEKFIREVVQETYGTIYDDVFRATARETAFAWLARGLGRHYNGEEVMSGDLLYKTEGDGPDGHVGVDVDSTRGVAENSSTHIGRVSGAKGYRTLQQWGHIDVLVRLPPPLDGYTVYVNDHDIGDSLMSGDTNYFPIREWAQFFGFDVKWDPTTERVSFNGQVIQTGVLLIGGHAYLPIRVLAQEGGLTLQSDDHERSIHITTTT